jgi:hypothetical protein
VAGARLTAFTIYSCCDPLTKVVLRPLLGFTPSRGECMRLWVLAAAALSLPATVSAQVYVHGYTKKDGTYVAPHYRSSPDGNPYNNWSTVGNVNPYTGQAGTKSPYSPYGSSYGSYSNPYSSQSNQSNNSSSSKTCIYYSPC